MVNCSKQYNACVKTHVGQYAYNSIQLSCCVATYKCNFSETDGAVAVARDCAILAGQDLDCQDASVNGVDGEICYCNTDGCNGASGIEKSLFLIGIAIMALFVKYL